MGKTKQKEKDLNVNEDYSTYKFQFCITDGLHVDCMKTFSADEKMPIAWWLFDGNKRSIDCAYNIGEVGSVIKTLF